MAKEAINKTEGQLNKGEDIFASDMTKKKLIPKINKQLIQFTIKIFNILKSQPNLKMGKRPKQTFFQRRYTDDQQVHEKMLNITNYQINENQNHEI